MENATVGSAERVTEAEEVLLTEDDLQNVGEAVSTLQEDDRKDAPTVRHRLQCWHGSLSSGRMGTEELAVSTNGGVPDMERTSDASMYSTTWLYPEVPILFFSDHRNPAQWGLSMAMVAAFLMAGCQAVPYSLWALPLALAKKRKEKVRDDQWGCVKICINMRLFGCSTSFIGLWTLFAAHKQQEKLKGRHVDARFPSFCLFSFCLSPERL